MKHQSQDYKKSGIKEFPSHYLSSTISSELVPNFSCDSATYEQFVNTRMSQSMSGDAGDLENCNEKRFYMTYKLAFVWSSESFFLRTATRLFFPYSGL